eukprot:6628971-Alexandrium_andersonii.AAC.1
MPSSAPHAQRLPSSLPSSRWRRAASIQVDLVLTATGGPPQNAPGVASTAPAARWAPCAARSLPVFSTQLSLIHI